jgi:hypothetical protein
VTGPMDTQSPPDLFRPRSIRRVFAVFLVLMVFTQLLLPYGVEYYYRRAAGHYVLGERLPQGFELIHQNFPSALEYIEKYRSDYDYNIMVLGDSVAYGGSVSARESIPAYLEAELGRLLPDKRVRVWNLAIPGSKPGDIYCALRRIEPLQPDAVVIDFDIVFYSRLDSPKPVAFDWLYLDDGLPADAGQVIDRYQSMSTADLIYRFVNRNCRLYHYREFLNALLFKGHPRKQLEQGLSGLFHRLSGAPEAPAALDETALRDSVAYMYDPFPIDPQHNNAYGVTLEILRRLREQGRPAVVFLADQNAGILGDLLTNGVYLEKVRVIDRALAESGLDYLNFTGKIPLDEFADNVHLKPGGNRIVAGQLAARLAPQLQSGGGVE